jgi:hypothetical protein
MALMNDDIDTAVQLMAPSVQHLHEMGGGSREQKDIFQDVLLALQRRLGNVDAVIKLAQRRLQRNPNHFQSLAAMAWAYEQSGQASLQQQTYQEIVDRAEQAPGSSQAPAFVEAQEALQSL